MVQDVDNGCGTTNSAIVLPRNQLVGLWYVHEEHQHLCLQVADRWGITLDWDQVSGDDLMGRFQVPALEALVQPDSKDVTPRMCLGVKHVLP